ncbi:SGNH/GDSL hydrolase family protein [Microbacterium terricola]|uniref:SGNH hydrolase-type esterase domain-containing protein n=1 Tax=Microbacterium terricola TaxID=344163 RepID=A0ABM8DX23_9MICO|nr:SGNH/GDSL hydrolase family protein [Microbacterium terricola]UYK39146.1 SGNH/GDSL hydrolase family protein [Microbacterium terricola]BDV30139.1 hypothetical protein Microterr_07990 [Microbacterium terricola]
MTTPDRPRTARLRWVFAGLAVAVIAVAVVAVQRPWAVPTEPLANAEDRVIAAAPLSLPEDATVLVFGDSWTYGSAATVPTLGYAYRLGGLLGWTTLVDGVRGSGYLKPGIDGPAFGERIADLDPTLDPDLVIVQGSINDRVRYPSGYEDAVNAAWDALADVYPAASVVILGPAPQVLPVEANTARMDSDLAALAAARGWAYISPIHEEWITAANYADVIDTSDFGRDHPSDAGHAYLAERLAASLTALVEVAPVSAGAPADAP